MNRVLLASNNAGKVKEFREILTSFTIVTPAELGIRHKTEEDGETFMENAQKKAVDLFRISGLPTIADDSGLCVEALGGAPGVFSARYSGDGASDCENLQKLLNNMAHISNRRAKFICAIYYIKSNEDRLSAVGECEGEIAFAPAGESGFGYDPIFLPKGHQVTMAQLDSRQKNAISHRRNALAALMKRLDKGGK